MSGRFPKLTMRDVLLTGKIVLVRVDYNVPLTSDGKIADDYRIRMSLPTIRRLLQEKCRVVLISHLGRPEGKADERYSLEVVAHHLATLLDEPVRFVDQTIGPKVHMAIKRAPNRSVTVLENLRFHPEEEANDPLFAKHLAIDTGAAYFIQDGFGVVHRAHASTDAITMALPSVAGLLLEKEYLAITDAIQSPKRPLVAVLGGAKVSDKIPVIEALVDVADTMLIGGAMANTFLAYQGVNVRDSMHETDQSEVIERIYAKVGDKVGAEEIDNFLVLPKDVAVGTSTSPHATRQNVTVGAVPDGAKILDIGEATTADFVRHLQDASTVIWNGTLGYAESPAFAAGSKAVMSALAERRGEVTTVIGGGDTADFVIHHDARHGDNFTHVSTGGGASLELMSGQKLPGIESLLDARRSV